MCTFEIKDLHCLTNTEEVEDEIKRHYSYVSCFKMGVTSANSRKQKSALVTVLENKAGQLLYCGKINIGLIIYQIRLVPTRCFKCWVYGHIAEAYKGRTEALCLCCVLCKGSGCGSDSLFWASPGLQTRIAGSEKSSTMIQILQANMHRSPTAHDLIRQMVQERRADLLLLSKQYRNKSSSS